MEPPLVDTGTAPKFFVSGLGRVTPMGAVALFSFYVLRPPSPEGESERIIEVELIAPVDCVGPGFDMAIAALGAKALMVFGGQDISRPIVRSVLF